jgi:hypothetical protein
MDSIADLITLHSSDCSSEVKATWEVWGQGLRGNASLDVNHWCGLTQWSGWEIVCAYSCEYVGLLCVGVRLQEVIESPLYSSLQ